MIMEVALEKPEHQPSDVCIITAAATVLLAAATLVCAVQGALDIERFRLWWLLDRLGS